MESKLHYIKPAKCWDEALPLGNGRLGAMFYGDVNSEEIQLNEESIWAGPPVPENRVGAHKYIKQAQEMLFNGEYVKAQDLIQNNVMSERIAPRSYQTLGSLFLKLNSVVPFENYSRELNISNAVGTTNWTSNNIKYKREIFISPVSQVLVCKTSCDKKGGLTGSLSFKRESGADVTYFDSGISVNGQAEHSGKHKGVKFASRISVKCTDGIICNNIDSLKISGATSFTIYLSSQTDYNFKDPYSPLLTDLDKICLTQVTLAEKIEYKDIKEVHIKSHKKLYDRMELSLGDDSEDNIPTDIRLQNFEKTSSPSFIALYFNFARYLTICSSRQGCLSANLQGIWNKDIEAIWNSDYHININIQMIYWLAEAAGLHECHEPFLDLVEALVDNGRITAKEVYNCRGSVSHHTTDIWRFTPPFGDVQYGMWPMGFGWNSRHFMEHYDYTGDKVFLRERAFPIIRDAALFFLDFLVPDPKTGRLTSGPTSSPENMFLIPGVDREKTNNLKMSNIAHERFYTTENGVCNLTMGPAMDLQIIWETFFNYLKCLEIMNITDDLETDIKTAFELLDETKIGKDGRLMEWSSDLEEVDQGHRHISHIYGVYPGFQYSKNEKYLNAAKQTILTRTENGGGHTGWSRAWIVNLWARLKDVNRSWENLKQLITNSTLPNLFDNHPPFQMDGNMGGASGLLEMIVQSHKGYIELFPSLPKELSKGKIKGLRVRGGFILNFEWKDSKLINLKIKSINGNDLKVLLSRNIIVDLKSTKTDIEYNII